MAINSQHYEKALKLMGKGGGHTKSAKDFLEKAAEEGDGRAIYALGTWWFHGAYGLTKDIKKGLSMWREAAQKGIPEACFDLAVAIEKNEDSTNGVETLADAFIWYLSAAIRGDAQAIFEVGRCYCYGIGIVEDKRLANVWFERAEELGVYERDSN